MISIAICDDQPEHGKALHALLREYMPLESEITEFQSADTLLSALCSSVFDVFFLDVELGNESGILLAREMNARFPDAQIVFVTSNITNAVDVGEANHTYFLTKPVNPEKLKSALNRVLQALQSRTDRRLSVLLRGGGSGVVSSGAILYCERTKRTTTVVCAGETLATPESLDELAAKLPKLLFARPHNSFLVNLMHVGKLERTEVHLDDGTSIPVSNQRKKEFRNALAEYVTRA